MLSEYIPGSPLLPGNTKAPEYMVRLSKKTIGDADCSGPKTISEILTNMRFNMNAYPGAGYKFRLLLGTLNNSVFYGRLSRLHE
jgi:hypothetical protein